jgi:hypothetical protein
VNYAFWTSVNGGGVGVAQDFTCTLEQGMPVVVFCDPLNLTRNVIREGSFFKLVSPPESI